MLSILSWIVFGALAGWVASILMGTNRRQGCIGNIVVGILGALIGGFLLHLLTGRTITGAWRLDSFLVAVVGAVILLAVTGWFRRRR